MRRRSHRHDNRLRKRRSSRADDRQARRSQRRHLGPSIGTFGPVALTGEDHGCVTDDPGDPNQPWANTTENRSYVVSPAQDRSGYFVTRYDLNGAFTAILDRQHPGCTDSGTFTKATKGTWNGVWTQKVSGKFDYNRTPASTLPARAGTSSSPTCSAMTVPQVRRWPSSATSSITTTRAAITGATPSTTRTIPRTRAGRSETAS